jgi:LysM repeat protein
MPLVAQSPETGEGPDANAPRALPAGDMGDPGASQDAEASREKLLKAADQLDNIEANSESTKAALDGMKSDLARLSDENTALKAQVSTLQDTITKQQDELDEIKAGRAKERQALIDEVSALLAEKTAPHHSHPVAADDDDSAPPPKKHVEDDDDAAASVPAAKHEAAPLAPPPEASGPTTPDAAATDAVAAAKPTGSSPPPPPPAATVHPRKGYYHVVAAHETLSLICEAYRDNGVKVTVAQIRHANGLTSKTELKVGQKLFIPKPST